MNILVTGCAGFIGSHLTKRLLTDGHNVIGIDNINDYYDVELKYNRLKSFQDGANFKFSGIDITNKETVDYIMKLYDIDMVIHLAAQAGVRYCQFNPDIYIETNITGFYNILECAKDNNIRRVLYASSSSAKENKSLYGVTKSCNEQMAEYYRNSCGMNITGFRFFTVYGPWGRPDMAYWSFTDNIINDKPITLFNEGNHKRDFTYIDDIVNGLIGAVNTVELKSIYDLGSGKTVSLMRFIHVIEDILDKESKKLYTNVQHGDIIITESNIESAQKDFGYEPKINIENGLKKFIDWYTYYKKAI